MKNIALILVAIVLVSSLAFAGDMAKSGQWGVNSVIGLQSVGVGFSGAGVKFMASENMAVRAEVGFSSTSTSGGSGSASGYGIGAGLEFHQTAIGGVSPYFGVQAGYSGESLPNGGTNASGFSVMGVYGGEYFFSSNFSWAGEIGVGFRSAGPSGATTTTFGTGSADMVFTWYLN